MMAEIEELIAVCKHSENVYIYGAGKNASDTYCFFQEYKIQIAGFLVSSMYGNTQVLFGHPVMDIDDFSDDSRYIILVPMFRNTRAYREICDCLVCKQICNVYFLSSSLLQMIKEHIFMQKKREIFHINEYRLGEHIPVEKDYDILIMEDIHGQEYHWRFPQKVIGECNLDTVCDIFPDKSALQEFEEQYGTYHIFCNENPEQAGEEKSFAVYMARSHKDQTVLQDKLPSWVIPIQVGAALTDQDICIIKDQDGLNISERNENYSECTALYWMWKNAPRADYIGLCHYRRHFSINENEIRRMTDANIDILVTTPTFVQETVGTFFSTLIPESDIKIMLEAIKKVCPVYLSFAKDFLASRFYPPCNLFIMRYNLFLDYSSFVFSVTFEIENYYKKIRFYRKDRYMGFIIECLLGIFLMKNREQLKIAYTDMLFYL